ncbi:terpenoid cyclases/protein prenyltransferase alpha-alpha toroid [Dipodascopsis tothii]|uniref:terpenoid cyclases/protein prenyltransferase alpha-alpha toroid n=1 Tax=Dipodascopsis tothii TaxID=44089 RepID=UPI0034CFFE5E
MDVYVDTNELHSDAPALRPGLRSVTTESQEETAAVCQPLVRGRAVAGGVELPALARTQHVGFLLGALTNTLPSYFTTLDASRAWILFWSLNALATLDPEFASGRGTHYAAYPSVRYAELRARAVESVFACWSPAGGFAGGNGQMAHLAPCYAAMNALAIAGDESAWARVDRAALLRWLRALKQADGSFVMHVGGEADVRAMYCALAVAALANVLTEELVAGAAAWVASCQTYEGGFGGAPGDEAHGGYTFCALAALCVLVPPAELGGLVDMPALVRWLGGRQYAPEGGFSGRTHKLVDGCYAWWVGGSVGLVEAAGHAVAWSRADLQKYVLACCQDDGGGLRDKPTTSADLYHTCYALAGLSAAQTRYAYAPMLGLGPAFGWTAAAAGVAVDAGNAVGVLNPVLCVPAVCAARAQRFFAAQGL